FTGGLDALRLVRRDHVVERARAVRRELVVGIPRVVDHLVLPALRRVRRRERRRELFGDVVLHTAVSRGRDLPFPGELEVPIRAVGDEVKAEERLAVGLDRALVLLEMLDRAVLNGPEPRRNAWIA